MDTDAALSGAPITSLPEFIARMEAIGGSLPAEDGLACFNRMYLHITTLVAQRLSASFFADPAFMNQLDVVFGNRYLAAVAASITDPAQVPRAWAALLDQRSDRRICPLQFALAGMNAHINYDLPLAVVATCVALATAPEAGSHFADYTRIDDVLAAAEQSVRKSFEDEWLLEADRQVPGLQDVVANWDIVRARQAAWVNARTVWALRQAPPDLQAAYRAGLDRFVGFAGRGLLVPLRPAPFPPPPRSE